MVYQRGATYDGEWQSNRRHGQGKETQPDGHVYSGSWVSGLYDGTGTMVYPNGEVFLQGQWEKGGRAAGEGTYEYLDGTAFTGPWVASTGIGDRSFAPSHMTGYGNRGFAERPGVSPNDSLAQFDLQHAFKQP